MSIGVFHYDNFPSIDEERCGNFNMNFLNTSKPYFIRFMFLFLFIIILHKSVQAYYGYNYGGLYGSGYYDGTYGGLYGLYGSFNSGLYGGLYGGGLGGLYSGGLYGLYGGLYSGGLYGSLYGNSYAGLFGGLTGLYSGYGLYGGLLGVGGLYGLGLSGLGGIYGLGGVRYGLAVAEQAGTWEGVWSAITSSGPIILNIVEDPITPTAFTGSVQLVNNTVLPNVIPLTGNLLNNQIILSGTGLDVSGTSVEIQVVGTFVSSTEISGNYTINKIPFSILESGGFEVTLSTTIL